MSSNKEGKDVGKEFDVNVKDVAGKMLAVVSVSKIDSGILLKGKIRSRTVGDSVAVKDTDLEKVKELMLIAGKRKTLESGTEEAAELEKMMLSHPEWTYDELTHLDDQTEKEQNK
eukprot:CAMPEP_0170199140 /NCGR_PEP_ID=MMETSP0040_2-20121228/69174_1 /TAXON_ID=641309 /ORGANISM="Lotharella oceanica, Strain CCMP622" /LENGTH=114 /DNA_ID=CAMNT_0010449227 /DNA_START=387 /DNA_END=731 /DNA_ORIENTATION=-